MVHPRIKFLLAKSALIFIACFIGLIAFWLFYPYKVLVLKNNPAPVLADSVEAGQMVVYFSDFCRYTNLPAIVTRQFIDGVVYTTPSENVTDIARCDRRIVSVRVPPTLMPDKYHIKVIVQIKVNPIRTMTYEFLTEEFNVTNKVIESLQQQATENKNQIDKNTGNIKKNAGEIKKIEN
jgi:hypothetical protein